MNQIYHHNKHELLAIAFAALFTANGLLHFGGVHIGEAKPVLPGEPFSLGVTAADESEVDALYRAGEEETATVVQEQQEPLPTAVASSNLATDHTRLDAAVALPAETPVPADLNLPDGATAAESVGERQSAPNPVALEPLAVALNKTIAEPQLDPTAVEQAPKPVKVMTASEVEQAVADYEQWVHRGEVQVQLHYDTLSETELGSVTRMYFVESKHVALVVNPASGGVEEVHRNDIPSKKLIGDLPASRGQWPRQVAEASKRFGANAVVQAQFLLTDECALKIYRVLGQHVSQRQPSPGTRFEMRLVPQPSHIQVEIVRINPPAERTVPHAR